jgi:hypothetical protein
MYAVLIQLCPSLALYLPCVVSIVQARLAAGEVELDELKAILSACKERDAFLAAYRHEGALDDDFAFQALDAHCWPKEMNEVFNK